MYVVLSVNWSVSKLGTVTLGGVEGGVPCSFLPFCLSACPPPHLPQEVLKTDSIHRSLSQDGQQRTPL